MAELNFLTREEIQTISDLLDVPQLEVITHLHWGSKSPHYREQIHNDLKTRSQNFNGDVTSSISHCRSLGGYAMAPLSTNETLQLGFDIEEDARVTADVAQRICLTDSEFERAPSHASLWSAKEAAYKALKGPKQPSIVSFLEIVSWKILNSQYETASVKDPQKFDSSRIEGVLFKKIPYTLAFFALRA